MEKDLEQQYNEAVDNDPAIQAIINSDINEEIKNEEKTIKEEPASKINEEPAANEEEDGGEGEDSGEESSSDEGDSRDSDPIQEEIKPIQKPRNDASKRINELVRKNKENIEQRINDLVRYESSEAERLAYKELSIKSQAELVNKQLSYVQDQYYSAMELGDNQKAKELDLVRLELLNNQNMLKLYAEDFEIEKRRVQDTLKAVQAERNQLVMSKQNPVVAQDKSFAEFLGKHPNLDRNSESYNPDDEQEVFVIATNIERSLKERGEGHLVRTKWFWNEVDRAINSYQEKMQAPSKTLPLKPSNVDVAPVVKQNSPRGQVVGSNKLPDLNNEEREMALSLRHVVGGNLTDKQLIELFAKNKKLAMQEEKRGR